MLDPVSSLFTLRWTQQRHFRPLPSAISRSFVPTAGGDLELLISKPKPPNSAALPIFFIHGGYGHAGVWLEWMTYLREAGYGGSTYSYSARNHGTSYVLPYFHMVYRSSIDDIADDVVACIQAARELEGGRDAVLVGHSSGGGLVQYVLANGRVKARALCLLDAAPHFGNFCMYANWARHDPWFLLRSLFHLQHPTSPLSSTKLVHGAFFCSQFPMSGAQEFARWMPAYESMGWAMGMGWGIWAWLRGRDHWLEPRDILRNISSTQSEQPKDSICIMIGSEDMMLHASIWDRQAAELRAGARQLRADLPENSESTPAEDVDGAQIHGDAGVRLAVIDGAGHHLQNDLQRDVGAEALLRFIWQC